MNQTAFDRYAQSLGLDTTHRTKTSKELRAWVERYRFTKYVPEELLIFWGLQVDPEDERLLTTRELAEIS